jgi:hypothetical protein
MIEALAENAFLQRFDVDHDVGQFGHEREPYYLSDYGTSCAARGRAPSLESEADLCSH